MTTTAEPTAKEKRANAFAQKLMKYGMVPPSFPKGGYKKGDLKIELAGPGPGVWKLYVKGEQWMCYEGGNK